MNEKARESLKQMEDMFVRARGDEFIKEHESDFLSLGITKDVLWQWIIYDFKTNEPSVKQLSKIFDIVSQGLNYDNGVKYIRLINDYAYYAGEPEFSRFK